MDIKQKFILSENDIKEAIINHVRVKFPSVNAMDFTVDFKHEPIYHYRDTVSGYTVSAEVTTENKNDKR